MFLNFSDAAKFADIAKNLLNGLGYGSNFSFWSSEVFGLLKDKIFSYSLTPPIMPFSIAAFFKIFGVSDFAVIATSFFYFVLTLIFVYLFGRKLFGSKLVGVLSTLAVGFSYDLIHYAISGASESPFIFEIVAASYFVSLKKKWANVVTIVFLVLLYFTRPLAFIYIAGIILFWLFVNFAIKKAILYFVGVLVIGVLVDYLVLLPLTGKYFLYSVIFRVLTSSFNQTSASSDILRGAGSMGGGLIQTFKNIFYNLYNYYKLLPQIVNPYLFTLYIVGLFINTKDRIQDSFRKVSLFILALTFLITAASIPLFRYIHPVIPLVYIIAVGTLVWIIAQLFNGKLLVIVSSLLILFFAVGQTVGVFLLDSRFERNTHNVGKPPVYYELSKILQENTSSSQVVMTNLDTWGSWYGERKTVWFSLEPVQIIDPATGKIPFDAIYLTSYLIDDQNYYMGTGWRVIFENPMNSSKWICDGCPEIAKEFSVKGVYSIPAADDYERQDAKAVLLIKK